MDKYSAHSTPALCFMKFGAFCFLSCLLACFVLLFGFSCQLLIWFYTQFRKVSDSGFSPFSGCINVSEKMSMSYLIQFGLLLVFETGLHVAQVGIKLAVQSKMIVNSQTPVSTSKVWGY